LDLDKSETLLSQGNPFRDFHMLQVFVKLEQPLTCTIYTNLELT